VELNTADPHWVVVTRVSSSGFFATDLADAAGGYNHMYAYNFSAPWGMRVCDRLVYLSGTVSDFFGMTELSFPSYSVTYNLLPAGQEPTAQDCLVPEPTILTPATLISPVEMEKLESGLVRAQGFTIAAHFGPELAVNNAFDANRSSCDLNQDGVIDYTDPLEGSCSDACSADPKCSEWSNYSERGNYKIALGNAQVLINTSSALGFDPLAHRGEQLNAVSGTLRNFSGGSLNWTIETRCLDDLVCGSPPCPDAPVPSYKACVDIRTQDDPDEGSI
jgi:hypothetical protein